MAKNKAIRMPRIHSREMHPMLAVIALDAIPKEWRGIAYPDAGGTYWSISGQPATAGTWINGAVHALLRRIGNVLTATSARVKPAGHLQSGQSLMVAGLTVCHALIDHGFIPVQAKSLQSSQYVVGRTLDAAHPIDILNANQPDTLVCASVQPTAQRSNQRAKVKPASG